MEFDFFRVVRLLRDARLSPQKTRGVPTKRDKARRYTQTVVSARGGEVARRTFVRLEKMRRWRDELAATEDAERFLSSRPGAQKPCAGKSRAAPFGMTGWSGARDAQPLQVGLNCDAPPALQSGWRDELAATRMGRDSSRKNTRDGAAVLRGREERFLPTRPGAQTTRARKNRAAPLGMTGWSGARDAGLYRLG